MSTFLENAAPEINNVADTLSEFIAQGKAEGFTLAKPKGKPGIIFKSASGNPQMLFLNAAKKRVYVRISTTLDAALRNKEQVQLENCPVRKQILEKDGNIIGSMLVCGMPAEAQDFEAADLATAFKADYVVA